MTIRFPGPEKEKQIRLDTKDKKILELLSKDARMKVSEMAKRVRLGRDNVAYRIKRMVEKQVILRFYPDVDFRKLGYRTFHVFLLLSEKDKARYKDVIRYLETHPNVIRVMEYSDQWDLEVVMIARSIADFDSMFCDLPTRFPDTVIERAEVAVIEKYYSVLFPYDYFKSPTITRIRKSVEPINRRIDDKDLQILKLLSLDCRMSTYEISKRMSLSPDAIRRRIKRYVETGVVHNYTIMPNLFRMGFSWHTFVARFKSMDEKTSRKIRTFIKDHPYIISAKKTLGIWDLVVYLISDDPKELHQTIKEIKEEFAETIKTYATFIAYREHSYEPFPDAVTKCI